MQTEISIITKRRPASLRCLPPVQSVDEFADLLAGEHPAQFQPGDIVTFDQDGDRHIVTVLGFAGDLAHLMFYNGQPYHMTAPAAVLDRLRVVRLDRMDPEDLAQYRGHLGREARQ